MFNFSGFMDKSARKYISLKYNNETQNKLRRWAVWNGFDLTKTFKGGEQPEESFDFHTTIFYTTTRHVLPTGVIEVKPKSVRATGFKMLGKEEDVPVLSLGLDTIGPIRKHYEEMGLKDEWPYYQPHVSLSYAKQNPSPVPMELPQFDLVFDAIVVKDILDNPE